MTQLDFLHILTPCETVNKSDWSFDYALTQPDTPLVAQHRRHEIGMRFMLGVH